MQYQRSYKLGKNPLASDQLGFSQVKMRRSMRGSMLADKKDRQLDLNRPRKDYFRSEKKPEKGKEARLRTEPSRNKSEIERGLSDVKAARQINQDLKDKNQDKLSRMFVIRAQTNIAVQKMIPVNRPSQLPAVNASKVSSKSYGPIKAYAANTHSGLYRKFNEDRISISLNIEKERSIHCMGVYDGHGGAHCAEYLSNNLFDMFIEKYRLLNDIQKALAEGFVEAERRFLQLARSRNPIDKSGSCALVTVIVGDTVYVCNLGDSRAVLIDRGRPIQLTEDHKPSLSRERQRIERLGGKIYQTKFSLPNKPGQSELGPCRVWPGRLSVSRTIGDIEAKDTNLGGIEGVVSSQPDIRSFKITPGSVLVLACDGIYDRLVNQDLARIFSAERLQAAEKSLHQTAGVLVEECLREAMVKDSYDNLSAISVMF